MKPRTAAIALLLGGALLLILTAAPAAAQSSDNEGTPCNDDTECTGNLICQIGVCTKPQCTNDDQCGFKKVCANGWCSQVECKNNAECGGGLLCDTQKHECIECFNSNQCGDRQICTSANNCVDVQCTSDSHCAFGERCAPGNTCVDRCSPGQSWVEDGRRCGGCVTAQASTCGGPGDCAIDQVCATNHEGGPSPSFQPTGYCIDACGPRPEIVQLQRVFRRLNARIPVIIDGSPMPPNPPDCPQCKYELDLSPLRGTLERAGIAEPVKIQLKDSRGKTVAELGPFSPRQRSFASLGAKQSLSKPLAISGDGCGFRLAVQNGRGQTMAEGQVCLGGSGR